MSKVRWYIKGARTWGAIYSLEPRWFRKYSCFKTAFSVLNLSLCKQVGSENARLRRIFLCCLFVLLHLFLIVLNFTLCKKIGSQSPTTNATRSKMLRILVNFDSLSLFIIGTSCLVPLYFSSASLFFRGLRPHPFAFKKKRNQKLLYFCFCVCFFVLFIYPLSLPRSSHKALSKSCPYSYQPRENRCLSRFDFRGQGLCRMSRA